MYVYVAMHSYRYKENHQYRSEITCSMKLFYIISERAGIRLNSNFTALTQN